MLKKSKISIHFLTNSADFGRFLAEFGRILQISAEFGQKTERYIMIIAETYVHKIPHLCIDLPSCEVSVALVR